MLKNMIVNYGYSGLGASRSRAEYTARDLFVEAPLGSCKPSARLAGMIPVIITQGRAFGWHLLAASGRPGEVQQKKLLQELESTTEEVVARARKHSKQQGFRACESGPHHREHVVFARCSSLEVCALRCYKAWFRHDQNEEDVQKLEVLSSANAK